MFLLFFKAGKDGIRSPLTYVTITSVSLGLCADQRFLGRRSVLDRSLAFRSLITLFFPSSHKTAACPEASLQGVIFNLSDSSKQTEEKAS